MSEPIQSISQGNYILQGTVATSAGIVGDGSTQNPLRADETVLWEGSASNSAILSEPLSNFEKVSILLGPGNNNNYKQWQTFPATNLGGYKPIILAKGAANTWIQWSYINITDTALNVQYGKSFNFGAYNSTAATYSVNTASDENTKIINKVVGINRIANN